MLRDKYQFNYEFIKRLSFYYGYMRTENLIQSLKTHTSTISVRVNTQFTTAAKLLEAFVEKDIPAKQHPVLKEAILIDINEASSIPRKDKVATLNYYRSVNKVLLGSGLGAKDFIVPDDVNFGDEISLIDKKDNVVANGILMMGVDEINAKKKGVAIKITDSKYKVPNLNGLKEFLRGHFIIQTIPNMLIGLMVNLKPKDRLMDMITRNGDILSHIWQRNSKIDSKIIAIDNSAHRLSKFDETIKRLRMYKAPIEKMQLNMRTFAQKFSKDETFDWIIINPTSSETGLRPKIFEDVDEKNILEMVVTQKEFMEHAARLIKRGGTIFYITSSIDPAENEEIISYAVDELELSIDEQEIFLGDKCQSTFEGSELLQYFFPDKHDTPGQFIAKLTK
ncbi:MAG: hypothetical protein HZR80_12060 [Candidatus Heimdallarchaeota archaeon]